MYVGDKVVCHDFRNSRPCEIKGVITDVRGQYLVLDHDYVVSKVRATIVEEQ